MSASPHEIIRCLRYDGYTPQQAAQYCRDIGYSSGLNPWAECDMAPNYLEAARMLEAQIIEREWKAKHHETTNTHNLRHRPSR